MQIAGEHQGTVDAVVYVVRALDEQKNGSPLHGRPTYAPMGRPGMRTTIRTIGENTYRRPRSATVPWP